MNLFGNLIKIRNINKNHKYYREYSFLFFKLKLKNIKKYNFYKNIVYQQKIAQYHNTKSELDKLCEYRKNIDYIITCYIITYNHQDSIEKAINSILEQKTKYKYLIKILDDASSDQTTEICLEYARRYPEKIELVVQPINTAGKHASSIFRTINTKYYCLLDGDDYWCNENKIQFAVDFLENNPQYTMWAHDTYWYNPQSDIKLSYVHEDQKIDKIDAPVTFENYAYFALSARVCRNIIDFTKEYEANHKRDIFIYFAMLDKGPLYFQDEIMSVYVFNGKGVYSKLHRLERFYSRIYSFYKMNQYFKFRHDEFFTKQVDSQRLLISKKFFGKRLGWFLYIYFKRKKFLKKLITERKNKFNQIEQGHNLYNKEDMKYIKQLAKEQV